MEDYCIFCGRELKKGVFVMPWEDGDNDYAYIICPHCHEENIQFGYGDDD